jgi:NAD(P)-dependent dehydrogenase (short-subunit alcohol dehydrogenase family)
MELDLKDKTALITGGSRGIGLGIASRFLEAGANVMLSSRTADDLAQAAGSLVERGTPEDRVAWVAGHVGHPEDAQSCVADTVARFGGIDILFNNAGTNPYFGPMLNADGGAWDKTFEVNLKGYFWCAREVGRHLAGRGAPGSIISIASIAGLVASPMQGIYSMTKASVISMTKTLALELGPSGIRVNAIAPGFVDTRLASAVLKNDDLVKAVVARTPLGRYGSPDEIAGGAVYLASDAASFLTGHTLVIDGGLTIG